ncbi:MAG: LTA synthase family protein, partial [Chitinophagaceae bacterium]|nr:LTA synthase family protein [Chitinophagaceae bacterium]
MAIPIFFYHPSDSLQSFQKGGIIQQTDIMPSVLGFLGHREPIFGFGKNMFAKSKENWAVNYYGGFQFFQGNYLLQLNNATA